MRAFLLLALAALACGSSEEAPSSGSGGSAGSGGAAGSDASTGGAGAAGSGGVPSGGAAGADAGSDASDAGFTDQDGDGLDDAKELSIAESHFPFHALAPDDACPRLGVLFRASPHPKDATKWVIRYVVLFENDCGAGGHVGDDEVAGVLVDPSLPAPAGLLALRAISHQGTLCEKVTTCGSLPGCTPCKTGTKNGQAYPVLFSSKNKHGGYVDEGTCDANFICDFGGCTLNPVSTTPAFVNAGEPGKPLTNDLTSGGFITQANGWTAQELMNFDPWANKDFGGAGNVTDDLGDPAFVIEPSGC